VEVKFIFVLAAVAAIAQTPEATFQSRCATCHSVGNLMGAPPPDTLRKMSSKAILAALETGRMSTIGADLTAAERQTVAKIGLGETSASTAKCSGSPRSNGQWNGWADAANTRFTKAAGLTAQTTPKLKLKWAFGFPGATTAFGSPAVIGGRVFVGDANGVVYALDASTGCTYWTYTAVAGVRVAPVTGGRSVYFGDLRGNVYALNVATSALLWKVRADDHPMAVITGSPKLDAGRLYVPVSGRDESIAAINPSYECCTFRGSVVALDAATGKRVWQAYTIRDEPKVTGQNAKGTKTWGPSGAVPWSSPTLDVKARVLYIGTGVNYSNPPTDTSDAILAIDMDSGRLLWSRQLTSADSYNFACGAEDKTNCPKLPFVDYDFGHSPVLRNRILFAGDKGGTVYALDADQQGKLLWKQKIASGGVNGGFMWGAASDDQGVGYIGISDFTPGRPEAGGGLIAFQLTTGEKLWMTPAPKPACIAIPGCSAAQPAPVTVIPGVAFLGSSDGHIRAYETTKGAIIWDFDTAKDFETVNGVKARGGSIISMGPVIAGGMLYITSGYGGNGMPGNVLLAFSLPR
jgi:polyvinyl alcohol dehydrogenase (cytochrome)